MPCRAGGEPKLWLRQSGCMLWQAALAFSKDSEHVTYVRKYHSAVGWGFTRGKVTYNVFCILVRRRTLCADQAKASQMEAFSEG